MTYLNKQCKSKNIYAEQLKQQDQYPSLDVVTDRPLTSKNQEQKYYIISYFDDWQKSKNIFTEKPKQKEEDPLLDVMMDKQFVPKCHMEKSIWDNNLDVTVTIQKKKVIPQLYVIDQKSQKKTMKRVQ